MKRVVHPVPSNKKWSQLLDDSWQCNACKSAIMAALQRRSVWLSDGPGPCAGTGEVEEHIIPFCPKCDQKPSKSGITYRTIGEDIAENL